MNFKLKNFNQEISVKRLANIHYFEFTQEYHTIGDSHKFCELVYVDKGEIFIKSDNFSGVLSDNEMIIHLTNEVHSLECSNDAPNIIIIGFECENEILEIFSKQKIKLNTEQKKMLSEILREGMSVYEPPYDTPNLKDMKKRDNYPFGADQMIKLRLEMFLISLIRESKTASADNFASPKSETLLENVKKYIEEHYCESIQLDNICFIFGTNKTSLCKSFKNIYGITILNYINQLKTKEAKRLLRENIYSVTQISEKLGFSSIHYFCKFFKKATGTSPVEYSRSIRSKLNI